MDVTQWHPNKDKQLQINEEKQQIMRNQNNKSKVTDTVDTSSLEQLIKKTNEEYSEDTFTNGLVKNMDLYDDIQVNVPRSMAKEPNKESIDQRRVLSKQKPKGKAPPKFAKVFVNAFRNGSFLLIFFIRDLI